ncbi:hypothetical protein [Kitasatospora brasiliensis]|uniref:hypothetical protein n=1 Tax=Kitasatospora brasiliensis TaxID=3058040 RepID=UPI0029317B33|nr:hypothetical protein [Kitasatospora sp. K002]
MKAVYRWTTAGIAAAVVAVLGSTAMASTEQAAPDASTPPPAVEDFVYPLDSPYPALTLVRGDGHIMLADCHTATQIQIWSPELPQSIHEQICFRVTGNVGYLALQLPRTSVIQTTERPVQATLTTEGAATAVNIPKNTMRNVGEYVGLKPTTLVELRVTG